MFILSKKEGGKKKEKAATLNPNYEWEG